MKKRRHSIKDIASANGVSVTTVSFVLNGKAKEMKISKTVTEKILKYVKKINYRPNQIAQSLRTGKSKILVFMVEDFYFFFAKIASIIEDLAHEKGYKVLFCTNDNDDNKSSELIELYKNIKVDGYIIIPSPGLMPKIKELINEEYPVVLFDRYFSELESNYVGVNNKIASYNATRHLISNNYKNIGFITTEIEQTQMIDRLKGYEGAISDAGLTPWIKKLPILEYNITNNILDDYIRRIIEETPELDAIYFSTNYLALSGLRVLKKNFPQYIDKLGIITFDDLDFFEIYTPSISAVSQPYLELAKCIMDLMFNTLNSELKNKPAIKIELEANLKIRESTRVR
ncbi:LacI family transcriptional regulator [Aureibaculum algae]|uniref:LacI family transcriptional regulator n=1 Tax=Aureibaculum algae TaxID=2584122 RepID=A0A5B7TMA7_9FLAO|nr:LacI family DNA-binding transcriptional regulator [Aureibaculum algae]QCX37398.1 LacI family transcriptional regulator [Aureibaculum algae]